MRMARITKSGGRCSVTYTYKTERKDMIKEGIRDYDNIIETFKNAKANIAEKQLVEETSV